MDAYGARHALNFKLNKAVYYEWWKFEFVAVEGVKEWTPAEKADFRRKALAQIHDAWNGRVSLNVSGKDAARAFEGARTIPLRFKVFDVTGDAKAVVPPGAGVWRAEVRREKKSFRSYVHATFREIILDAGAADPRKDGSIDTVAHEFYHTLPKGDEKGRNLGFKKDDMVVDANKDFSYSGESIGGGGFDITSTELDYVIRLFNDLVKREKLRLEFTLGPVKAHPKKRKK